MIVRKWKLIMIRNRNMKKSAICSKSFISDFMIPLDIMEFVKDVKWKPGIKVSELVEEFESNGFQSIEVYKAFHIIDTMINEKAKIILTFTSNMVTSGLRGLFAQWIRFGLVSEIVTTVGGLEEDIMKAKGEKFIITNFRADDIALYEKGVNRVGNLGITNDSYMNFEGSITPVLEDIARKKPRITPSELFYEIGKTLDDENSILYQAYKHNVPVFCPGVTDGAFGFHLFFVQQKNKDFVVDVVQDFKKITLATTQDDKKGLIALGGGISKHHALLSTLLSGGADYAVYVSSSTHYSGSMSGATTNQAKSWGKIKDDSDSVTVVGDATIIFPLISAAVFDRLYNEKKIEI